MDRWQALQVLTQKVESSPQALAPDEFERFVVLYREAVADLARARAESTNVDMIESLNAVVGAAYSALYRRPSRGAKATLIAWIEHGAQAFRRQFAFVVVSFITVFFFMFLAAAVLEWRSDLRPLVVSPETEPLFEQWRKGTKEERTSSEGILMTAFYASNNPRVSIINAAIGAGTFGLGTFYILGENGKLIGSLGHDMAGVGKLPYFIAQIAPHGASELSGMIVSGAAGYALGWALIAPGRRRRIDSLRHVAPDAMALFVMGVLMMYIAAPFEGFFSFDPRFDQVLKGIVGTLILLCWFAYWGFAGRSKERVFDTNLGAERPFAEEKSLASGSRS